MATKVDSNNASNLYFQDPKSSILQVLDSYVHPCITIRNDSTVVHGRGMVVTKDVSAGDCLFVTPPTVGFDVDQVKKTCLAGEGKLEDIATGILINNMEDVIARRHQEEKSPTATMNSFMVLMGSTLKKEVEVTLDLLNARDSSDKWMEEELQNVTRKDLRNVILKNGTGHCNAILLRSSSASS